MGGGGGKGERRGATTEFGGEIEEGEGEGRLEECRQRKEGLKAFSPFNLDVRVASRRATAFPIERERETSPAPPITREQHAVVALLPPRDFVPSFLSFTLLLPHPS